MTKLPSLTLCEENELEIFVEIKPLEEGDKYQDGLIFTTAEGIRHRVYPLMKDYFESMNEPTPIGYKLKKARKKIPVSVTEVISFQVVPQEK